tara:strand:+ start:1195 stop:1878 length:684 start_codon:yes stop_codon:yes gene_type:complete
MLIEKLKLPVFDERNFFLHDKHLVFSMLKTSHVKSIHHYVLGPEGSNISQAAEKWSQLNSLDHKTKLIYCDTPEQAVQLSNSEHQPQNISFAWTCAVYFKEHELFFKYVNHGLFFEQFIMKLDCMQLASKKQLKIDCNRIRVSAHPSPAVLLTDFDDSFEIIDAMSNSQAAEMCAKELVDACITTESARHIHNLYKLHEFGSPEMVFFASLPPSSANLLQELLSDIK